MSYDLTITAESGPELADKLLSLAAMLTGVSHDANFDEPTSDTAPAETEAPKAEPKKRGRPKKEEPAPEAAEVVEETPEDETPEDETQEAEPVEEVDNTNPDTGNPWTPDEVRAAAIDYVNVVAAKMPGDVDAKRKALRELLDAFGVEKLSGVPAASYGAFIAGIRKREAAL